MVLKQVEEWFEHAVDKSDIALCRQIGCHIEEFIEFLEALGFEEESDLLHDLRTIRKYYGETHQNSAVSDINTTAVRDAIADNVVTGSGVLYQLGYSLEEDLKAVADSNDSKFYIVYDEDGSAPHYTAMIDDCEEICKTIEENTTYKGVHYKVREKFVVFYDENGKVMKNPFSYKEPIFKD